MTELEIYIRARYPLIYLVSYEEERAVATVKALATTLRKDVVTWSFTEGLGGDRTLSDPLAALEAIGSADTRSLYVMRDMHAYFGNPAVVRKLRELGASLKSSAKSLILLSPVLRLPPELTKDVTVVDFPTPDAAT
ncbi:MAG: ATPase, partial [Tepidisphaerales bacterium]